MHWIIVPFHMYFNYLDLKEGLYFLIRFILQYD